jgi:hypothetical protein
MSAPPSRRRRRPSRAKSSSGTGATAVQAAKRRGNSTRIGEPESATVNTEGATPSLIPTPSSLDEHVGGADDQHHSGDEATSPIAVVTAGGLGAAS